MNNEETIKSIEVRNKRIEDAVLVSQMMDSDGFKIAEKEIKEIEKTFRFQDILGIKEEALSDQKGIVLGLQQVIDYFKKMKSLAETPRLNPETGEPEVMRNAG